MSFTLDRERIYLQCPRCNFYSRPFLRQVRHQDVLICGGCKANIWLVDYIGQFRKAERQVREAVQFADQRVPRPQSHHQALTC